MAPPPELTRRIATVGALIVACAAGVPARAAHIEIPVAVAGAPLPADGPAGSVFRPTVLRATFRVRRTDSALYIGTPWFVRDLSITVVGPRGRRASIAASSDLPGHMLGLRLPYDAWQADRIELRASAVSSVAPPYLLSADQLAAISARSWWYAAFFGLFAALAVVVGGAAAVVRSRTAAWYALAAAAQAGLTIPWLGIVRPPPVVSQPLHAVLQTLAAVATTSFALAFVRATAVPSRVVAALWTLVGLSVLAAFGGDLLQDDWMVPDLVTQGLALALGLALVALGIPAMRARLHGAVPYVAGAALIALGALAGTLGPAASLPSIAAGFVVLAFACFAHLRDADAARAQRAPSLRVDGLTALPNRTELLDHLTARWSAALRAHAPLAAVLVDVDRFHDYNECYGHLAGDELLRQVAAAVAEVAARDALLAGRYGGDEFLMLVPDADIAHAQRIAGAARAAVTALDAAHGGVPSKRVSVSVGVASAIPDRPGDGAELLRRASDALYVAKTLGRNRVVAG